MEHEIELKTSTHISFLEMSFSNKVKWFCSSWITLSDDSKTNYIFNILNTYHELAYRHLGFLFSFPIMLFKKIIGPIVFSIFTFWYWTIYYNVSNHILSVQVLLIRRWYIDLFSSIQYIPLIDFFFILQAIDLFMSSCMIFVFLSLIEYAFVNVMMGDISDGM